MQKIVIHTFDSNIRYCNKSYEYWKLFEKEVFNQDYQNTPTFEINEWKMQVIKHMHDDLLIHYLADILLRQGCLYVFVSI